MTVLTTPLVPLGKGPKGLVQETKGSCQTHRVRIARVAEVGGSSMRMADTDPFDGSLVDPLEETLDDLASEWAETPEDEESLIWGD